MVDASNERGVDSHYKGKVGNFQKADSVKTGSLLVSKPVSLLRETCDYIPA